MSRLRSILATLLLAILAVNMIPLTASAVGPECYRQNPGTDTGNPTQDQEAGPVRRANCGNAFKNAAAEQFDREPENALKDNRCYVLRNGTIEESSNRQVCDYLKAIAEESIPDPPSRPDSSAGTSSIERGEGFSETDCSNIATDPDSCGIIKMANAVIKFLSAMVGVVVTAMIVAGGVRYTSAGSDPQAVGKAKEMIRNAVIALICYIFLLAFLNWVVPGGIV